MLHIFHSFFCHLLQLLSALSSHLPVAAVRSKVVVLLLLIHCILLLPLFYGGSVFGACFVMQYLVSFMMLMREVVALLCVAAAMWLLVFCVSSLSWSVVCDYGICPGHMNGFFLQVLSIYPYFVSN